MSRRQLTKLISTLISLAMVLQINAAKLSKTSTNSNTVISLITIHCVSVDHLEINFR